jgi:hypothetical protein
MDSAYFEGVGSLSTRGCTSCQSEARGAVVPTELMSMDQFRRSGYFRASVMPATYLLDSLEPDLEGYTPEAYTPGATVWGTPANLMPVVVSAVALGAFLWYVSKNSRAY